MRLEIAGAVAAVRGGGARKTNLDCRLAAAEWSEWGGAEEWGYRVTRGAPAAAQGVRR